MDTMRMATDKKGKETERLVTQGDFGCQFRALGQYILGVDRAEEGGWFPGQGGRILFRAVTRMHEN
jgi:hypothetical protein